MRFLKRRRQHGEQYREFNGADIWLVRILIFILVVGLFRTYTVGVGAATKDEKISQSMAIDPKKDYKENQIPSVYNRFGQLESSDGKILWSLNASEVSAPWFVWIGDPGMESRRCVAGAYSEELQNIPYNLLTGYKNRAKNNIIHLTVNSTLQEGVHEYMMKHQVTGTALLVDRRTGAIQCMVSTPSVSRNNEEGLDTEDCWLNKNLYTHQPASVAKVLLLMEAVRQGVDLDEFTFNCTSIYRYKGSSMEFSCPEAHGKLHIEDALGVSCNCFFASLIARLDMKSLMEDYKNMGLHVVEKLPGIEMEGARIEYRELGNLILNTGSLAIQSEVNFADSWKLMGQGSFMNPIQMAWYVACISNDGCAPFPYLVKGEEEKDTYLLDEDDLAEVKSRWESGYQKYYDAAYKDLGILAAKTGTCQLSDTDLREGKRLVGYTDEYVFYVTIENYQNEKGDTLDILPVDIVKKMLKLNP